MDRESQCNDKSPGTQKNFKLILLIYGLKYINQMIWL